MKFAFVIFKYNQYSDTQRVMLRTAHELAKREHSINIFTMKWQGSLPAYLDINELPQDGGLGYLGQQSFVEQVTQITASNELGGNTFDYIVGFNKIANLDAYVLTETCYIDWAIKNRSEKNRMLPSNIWLAECERAVFSTESKTEILTSSVSLTGENLAYQHWYKTPAERLHHILPYLSPVDQDRYNRKSPLTGNMGSAEALKLIELANFKSMNI